MELRFGLACALLAACGAGADPAGHDAQPPGAPDGGGGADGAAPDAAQAACGNGDDATWVQDYEREVVAKLSGAQPIAPGVTLTDRSTSAARMATRAYLADELARWGYTPELFTYDQGADVYARLPATVPGVTSTVIVGAHFDGVAGAPAAADDGTGTAMVLAAARHFASEACRSHDLLFVFFDQEEVGLVGSTLLAQELRASGADIAGMQAYDMLSWDSDGDRAVELWSPTPAMETIYQAAAADVGVPIHAAACRCSDHTPFLDEGFAATGMGEAFIAGDTTPNYHQPTDTYDNIDFDYTESATRLAFAALARQVAP